MGALVMTHSDDNGLVLPPKLAPIQVVIVPIYRNQEQFDAISKKAQELKTILEKQNIRVKYDDRNTYKPGYKFAEWEFKGVPLRMVIGPRDLENQTIELARRDTLEKEVLSITDIDQKISHMLDGIQKNLFQKAIDFRNEKTYHANTWEEFVDIIENKGGFVYAHWDGTPETEQKIKEETKATIRAIPLEAPFEEGTCIYTGNPSHRRVIFARAY
jgi:prolyl-tRNA synthetase